MAEFDYYTIFGNLIKNGPLGTSFIFNEALNICAFFELSENLI